MKTINIILFLFIGTCSKAQTIVNILDDDGSAITNTYYKDVNNLLDVFEGAYVYANAVDTFKIVLMKKVQQYNGRYYEDLIIGEYQYVKNGVQIANTLSEINTVYDNQSLHKISGNTLINNNHRNWICPDCNLNEKRLKISIKDVVSGRYATLIVRRTSEGGSQIMKIKVMHISGGAYDVNVGPQAGFALPVGELTLVRQ